MSKVIVYFAHPGQRYSHVNKAMQAEAKKVDEVTHVDLYAEYPRFDINQDREQQRLLDHDVIVFQFPLFWYSTPSILKEWQDLVLENGFAYGVGGDKLAGKRLLLAVSAAGPDDAYSTDGYQNFDLRTFLRPLEQTANLCEMIFLAPYVLYGSLKAVKAGTIPSHAAGFGQLLAALRDDRLDSGKAGPDEVLRFDSLPIRQEA